MKHIIILFSFLLISLVTQAKKEIYTQRINGEAYNNGASTFTIQDGKYFEVINGNGNFVVSNVSAFVKLGIEEGITEYAQSAFDITIGVSVTPYNSYGVAVTPVTFDLQIVYDPSSSTMNDIILAVKRINNYHRLDVEITAVNITGGAATDLPLNSFMEVELEVERYYELDEYAVFEPGYLLNDEFLDINGDSKEDELSFYWNYIEGAEFYELEWTFVNNYNQDGTFKSAGNVPFLENEFKFNSTRIRTTKQHYEIPLIFDQGFIIYRMRPVGIWDNDDLDVAYNNEVFGKWSTWVSGTDSRIDVADFPHYALIDWDHVYKKNWQYQAVYAEDGKKKEVVSYLDGSLRNRQSATKISSNDVVVVGETIYDSEGRAAISILPVPTSEENDVLEYHSAFNINSAGTKPYSLFDFDLVPETPGPSGCLPLTPNGLGFNGAGEYYGAGVATEGNWQDHVPDANGYPFVQVQYMPDNTGRIAVQSGVGDDFTIDFENGDHPTRYFYSQPYQVELDRLFGTNVGYKKRYKKNIVIDPNGQVSVSYLDPFGRVIATALVGSPPSNLAAMHELGVDLSSISTLTVDLLSKVDQTHSDKEWDDNIRSSTGRFTYAKDALISSSTQYMYQENEQFKYKYVLKAEDYEVTCGASTYNYPFVYDLNVTLVDKCGQEMLVSPISTTLGSTSSNVGTETYDGISGAQSLFTSASPTIPIGEYYIEKKLVINESAVNELADQYILDLISSNCIPTEAEMQSAFQELIDLSGCEMTCAECFTNLGDYADYRDERQTDYPGFSTMTDPDSSSLNEMFYSEYVAMYSECDELCAGDLSYCDAMRAQMLMDVSPHGQYGAVSGDMLLSVYYVNNELPGATTIDWKNPASGIPYVNADGSPARIYVTPNGGNYDPQVTNTSLGTHILTEVGTGKLYTLPTNLAYLDDFLGFWENSWAESLLPAHPEYCYLSWCSDEFNDSYSVNSVDYTSEDVDNLLLGFSTWDEASSHADFGNMNDLDNLLLKDPIFHVDPSTSIYLPEPSVRKSAFSTAYTFQASPYQTIDLLEFAAMTVRDVSTIGVEPAYNASNYSVSGSDPDRDEIWELFRGMYISLKQDLYEIWGQEYAVNTGGCYNGCIGTNAYDPGQYGFIDDANFTDDENVCAYQNANEFYSKERRFFNSSNMLGQEFGYTIEQNVNNITTGIYENYGICPIAFEVLNFLNGLTAADGMQPSSALDLNATDYFGILLYEAFGGPISSDYTFNPPSAEVMTYTYSVEDFVTTNDDRVLEMEINNPTSSNTCNYINLVLPTYANSSSMNFTWDVSDYGTNWQIESFESFYFVGESSGVYSFQIIANVDDDMDSGTDSKELLIDGETCLMVGNCVADGGAGSPSSTDPGAVLIPCQPLEEAASLVELFNFMLQDNGGTPYFFSGSTVDLSTGTLGTQLTNNVFLDWMTTGGHDWDYSSTTGITTILITDQSSGDYYQIKFNDLPTFPTVTGFVNIQALVAPTFLLTAQLSDNSYIEVPATIEFMPYLGTIKDLALGDCGDCLSDPGGTIVIGTGVLVDNLLKDQDAADIPDIIYEILGLKGQEAGVTIADTIINNQFIYQILDRYDEVAAEFVMQVNDPSFDPSIHEIDSIGAFYLDPFSGNSSFKVPIIVDDSWIEITGQSNIPMNPCSCSDQIDPPLSCEAAYEIYHEGMDDINVSADPDLTIMTLSDFCALDYEDHLASYLLLIENAIDDGFSEATINSSYTFSQYVNSVLLNDEQIYNYASYNDIITGSLGIHPSLFEDVVYCEPCETLFDHHIDNSGTMTLDDFCGLYPESCQDEPLVDGDIWDDTTLTITNDCEDWLIEQAIANASAEYQVLIENKKNEFIHNYIELAMSSAIETFVCEVPDNEFNYTLYYYDQAGNLIRTVPPNGVNRVDSQIAIDDIIAKRNNEDVSTYDPEHGYLTSYGYNALNQLVIQRTPDGGTSRFWYDGLGRIVASQNQQQAQDDLFSYTKFDALGRIIEVGELEADPSELDVDGVPTTNFDDPDYPDNFAANSGAERSQITRTYYDEPLSSLINGDELNGRNRIGSVTYIDYYTTNDNEYQSAYHYGYDIHGNVLKMVQEIRREEEVENSGLTSTVDYEYDLVSGNVLKVKYNAGKIDQFYHKYEYDADNRITRAYTSEDDVNWISEEKYFYYDHGPLARTETGHEKIQGSDYAYTTNGWLKSVNGTSLNAAEVDMGEDGAIIGLNLNKNIGRDAYGFGLTYYTDDYEARTTGGDSFLGDLSSVAPTYGLFNGNISQMATAMMDINENLMDLVANDYQYDQLNRIVNMDAFIQDVGSITEPNAGYEYNGASSTNTYHTEYTYDHNGNLLKLQRQSGTTTIDDFTYHYYDNSDPVNPTGSYNESSIFTAGNNVNATNKLAYVDDGGTSGSTDLLDQNSGNYAYNHIGQLVSDDQEDIESIEWTVTGKVKKITRSTGSTKADLEFIYDPMGNRIAKIVKDRTGGNSTNEDEWTYHYYTKDASGNTMGVYQKTVSESGSELTETYALNELNLYGSRRVGLLSKNITVGIRISEPANDIGTGTWYTTEGYYSNIKQHSSVDVDLTYVADPSTEDLTVELGKRNYEFSNHLGNVLEVLSDKKLPNSEDANFLSFTGTTENATTGSNVSLGVNTEMTIEAWVKLNSSALKIIAAQTDGSNDRGMMLYTVSGVLRLSGYNSSSSNYIVYGTTNINDNAWHHVVGTYGANGEWNTYVDGVLEGNNPGASGNMNGLSAPVTIGSQILAGTGEVSIKEVSIWDTEKSGTDVLNAYNGYVGYTGTESGIVGYWKVDEGSGTALDDLTANSNNLSTTGSPTWSSEDLITYNSPDVISYSDYYPFGMIMDGRNGNSGDYRYGFNGAEGDNEAFDNNGSFYDLGLRCY
ncbi:MAG: LamG-like jellyroll fold domain-containing protein, partial [Crocinitomicaceae bacterium]